MWYLVKQYVALLERDLQEHGKKPGSSDDVIVNGSTRDNEERQRRSLRDSHKVSDENKENMHLKDNKADKNGEEVNHVASTLVKKPWIPVYLTPHEVKGLMLVVSRMKSWSTTNVPDDFENPSQLLDRLGVSHFCIYER